MTEDKNQKFDPKLRDGSGVSRDDLNLIQTWGEYEEEGNTDYRDTTNTARSTSAIGIILHKIGTVMKMFHGSRRYLISKMK